MNMNMKQTQLAGILGVAAMAAGAAAMYLLDPQMGRRRRALLRDKLEASRHGATDFARGQAKRAAGHLRGVVADAQSGMGFASEAATDRQLSERVRAQLGRIVSRPGAIDVSARDGCVCLTGHIVASEHESLVSAVAALEGVHEVEDRLAEYEHPGTIPELQGQSRVGQRPS